MSQAKLSPVVEVIAERCKNCHACIQACPVKFCNDGSGDCVTINADLCIGCGSCLKACTHQARRIMDDREAFFRALQAGERIVAIAAPAVASNFPGEYLRLNGWLKSRGVEGFFDTSFGAELTVKTYLSHLEQNAPKAIIAQPCPAIVSYVELYRPELISYLAPADSPMVHIMKMVREYYPQYRNHRFMVISPCIAKRREFDAVGIGDYNVTLVSLQEYLQGKGIDLRNFPEVPYENPAPERAVTFSTPGGLLETAERWNADIRSCARKIEGPHTIYHYLDTLLEDIIKGKAPVLIDCLNCELGCNGGSGTMGKDKTCDELEYSINQRREKMVKPVKGFRALRYRRQLEKTINSYWAPGLYQRCYEDRSQRNTIRIPSEKELWKVLETLGKTREKDIYNCCACGYNSCRGMAIALYNGINRPENCFHYTTDVMLHRYADEKARQAEEAAQLTLEAEETKREMLLKYNQSREKMIQDIRNLMEKLLQSTEIQSQSFRELLDEIQEIGSVSEQFDPIVKAIEGIADNMHLLALNATIEASCAGEAGKGFAVVAGEVKGLARNSRQEVEKITPYAEQLKQVFENLSKKVSETSAVLSNSTEITEHITGVADQLIKEKFDG